MEITYRRTLLYSAIAACLSFSLVANPLWAQDQVEEDEDTTEVEEAEQTEDRVTVTGSLLRRDEFNSASPIQVISAETQVQLGQVDTAEFLQKSSIAAGSTQINNQFGGFVGQWETRPPLRPPQ